MEKLFYPLLPFLFLCFQTIHFSFIHHHNHHHEMRANGSETFYLKTKVFLLLPFWTTPNLITFSWIHTTLHFIFLSFSLLLAPLKLKGIFFPRNFNIFFATSLNFFLLKNFLLLFLVSVKGFFKRNFQLTAQNNLLSSAISC